MSEKVNVLSRCMDIRSFRSTLHELCSEFGEVVKTDVVIQNEPGTRKAVCFLRLGSVAGQRRLAEALGAGWFGNDLLLFVTISADFNAGIPSSPTLPWSDDVGPSGNMVARHASGIGNDEPRQT